MTTYEVTTATSNRRLLKLAEFLEALPRKRFDFDSWVGKDWQGAQDLSCGTTACALGWAATMPRFRRLGLRLAWAGGLGIVVNEKLGADTPMEAAMSTFGLSITETHRLFVPTLKTDTDATPKQVARNIRRFVKERANY